MGAREDIDRLRDELAECIHAADGDRLRRIYRDLLRDGHSLREVIDDVNQVIKTGHGAEQPGPESAHGIELVTAETQTPPEVTGETGHSITRAAARLRPPIDPQIGVLDSAAQKQPQEVVTHEVEHRLRRSANRFSALKAVIFATSVAIALLAPGNGRFVAVGYPPAEIIAATAPIPPPLPEAAAHDQGERASSALAHTGPEAPTDQTQPANPNYPATALAAALANTEAGAAMSGATTTSSSAAAATNAPVTQEQSATLTSEGTADLLARGDAQLAIRDFGSARLFYERAANAGDGQAALRLGETYDPAFLTVTGFEGAQPNAASAAYWYLRADKLGAPDAQHLLRTLAADLGLTTRARDNSRKP